MPYYGSGPAGANPNVLLPDGALDRWQAAKATAGAQVVPVAMIGDSILRGHACTPRSGNGFAALLMAALRARYGDAGAGFKPCSDTLDAAYSGGGFSSEPQPCWSYSAGWSSAPYAFGAGGQAHTSDGAAGRAATGVFVGNGVDVVVGKSGGAGSFAVTVDGVPYDQFGAANGSGGNPNANGGYASPYVATSIRGLGPGQHSIVLTTVTGVLNLHGIVVYGAQGRGILPLVMGFSGKSAQQMLLNQSVDSAKASVELWNPSPKLVIFEHVVNDMQQGVSFDTFENNVRRVCDSARNCAASLVFVVPFIGPMAQSWANSQLANQYIDRIYNLAYRYGCAVLDVNAAWEGLGPARSAQLLAGGGNAHPNDAGHADIAARLQALLM